MQVSKLLKLTKIDAKLSATQRKAAHLERIKTLKKRLATGKLSPKLAQRCEEYIRSSEFVLRKIDGKAPAAKPAKKSPKAAAPKIDFKQGILPNFLSQLNTVRIEEMVAERIFHAIATNIQGVVATKKQA